MQFIKHERDMSESFFLHSVMACNTIVLALWKHMDTLCKKRSSVIEYIHIPPLALHICWPWKTCPRVSLSCTKTWKVLGVKSGKYSWESHSKEDVETKHLYS